jgi:hypothetical protein
MLPSHLTETYIDGFPLKGWYHTHLKHIFIFIFETFICICIYKHKLMKIVFKSYTGINSYFSDEDN